MTSLEALRESLPDYAKDTRINVGSVLTPGGCPDLTQAQILVTALASAYATRHPQVIAAIYGEALANGVESAAIEAAKAAATIMAMNNIYYRFTHLVHDEDIRGLPARLRMNVIGSPGVAKVDFELMSLAVSAINGCGMCMEAHTHELAKQGVSKQGIQGAVRIAAVVNAAAQALACRH